MEELEKIICKNFNISSINKKTNFVKDLGADSLSILEMIMDIEDKFNIIIPENDIRDNSIETVEDLIKYVKEKQNEKNKM